MKWNFFLRDDPATGQHEGRARKAGNRTILFSFFKSYCLVELQDSLHKHILTLSHSLAQHTHTHSYLYSQWFSFQ